MQKETKVWLSWVIEISLDIRLRTKIYLQIQMNTKLKTASSLSADSTQMRYQKALKQITKLIGINSQLKQEANKTQQYLNQFADKMDAKNSELVKVLAEKTNLEAQLKDLILQKSTILKENQDLKKQLNKLKNTKVLFQSPINRKETSGLSFDHDKLADSEKAVVELQRLLELRDQTIRELSRKVRLYEAGQGHEVKRYSQVAENRPQSTTTELSKKLLVANQYIEKMSEENVDLKSRLIKQESKNKLFNVKSMENFPKYTPQLSPRTTVFNGDTTRNSEQVLKRYHKLQQQNKKFSKRYEQMKGQITALSTQNLKLKKQNTKFSSQISGYQALITQQQNIIAQLHEQYEKEVMKMTQQFKKKLLDQRENFSPAKSADHLKMIETLQAQNKGFKKKLQLYSIEITKCYKTLEAYKAKLSQCEKDYAQLMNERDQLVEKLSRLQSSHRQNREKSIHSRGSASRIIPENERRNSMGQTGYFNYS